MMNQREILPVLTENGQPYLTTPLGRSTSINSSLSSHRRLFLSSSYSNLVSPFHLPLKRIKPEPWQRLFEGKKQQELSMKKTQSNADYMINEETINILNEHSVYDENSHGSFLPAPIQTHIDRLYEQIDDLILQLTDERLRHKRTRIRAEEKLLSQLKNQERRFQEFLEQTLLDHQNELNEQEKKYFKLFNEEQIQAFQREKQIKDELGFVKKSFLTYKVSFEKKNIEPLQTEINNTRAATKEEEKMNDALVKERKLMNDKHKIEIENIRTQYQNEMATMKKSFDDTTVDREYLESLKKELTSTKLELNQTKERAKNLSARLKDLESQHTNTIRELNDCRMRFDEQAKKIEKLYGGRVGQLH